MEQLASPGTTLLTANTLQLAEGYVDVRPLGPVPAKGLPEPIEVYDLVAAGPRRSRLHAAAARGLTRFVGRDAELEQGRSYGCWSERRSAHSVGASIVRGRGLSGSWKRISSPGALTRRAESL
jgi:hypothetical protein